MLQLTSVKPLLPLKNIFPAPPLMAPLQITAFLVMLLPNLELDPPLSPLLPSVLQKDLNAFAKMDTENPLPPNKIKLPEQFALLVETKLKPAIPPRL